MRVLQKFYKGSDEMNRIRGELERALSVLEGLLKTEWFATNKELTSVQLKKDGVLWHLAHHGIPKQGSRYADVKVSISCTKDGCVVYPNGGIDGLLLAHSSFDRFYAALCRRYPRIREYVERVEKLAPTS